MNYSHINRNSLMSNLYTDRPRHHQKPTEPSKPLPSDQLHLNPSKSKLNVRHSLNKSTDPATTSHHRPPHCRYSCVETTQPASTQAAFSPPQLLENSFFKAISKDHELSIDNLKKENICSPNEPFPSNSDTNYRKKSESLRVSSYNQLLPKWNQIKSFEPFDPRKSTISHEQHSGESTMDDVVRKITGLQRRVKSNEEEIGRLKKQQYGSPRLEKLANDVSKFNSELFEYYKFNANHFNQFQEKIQRQQKGLSQLKEKLDGYPKEDSCKKQTLLEARIAELYQGFKHQEEFNKTQLTHKLSTLERSLKQQIVEQSTPLKDQLLYQQKQLNILKVKVIKLEEAAEQDLLSLKTSTKICAKPIQFETKESVVVTQDNIFKDRTNRGLNYDITRQGVQNVSRKDSMFEAKKEFVVKQRTYYMDSEGYLLDENKFYLLNSYNQQIKVAPRLLTVLQENQMLGSQ